MFNFSDTKRLNPHTRRDKAKTLVIAASITQLWYFSAFITSTSEVSARRAPPTIAPLKMEYYDHPRDNLVIEPSYEHTGASAFKVYLTAKHFGDKKVVWKTLLYTANYYLISLHWYDKGHQYVSALDERQENYCIDLKTGRRVKPY
jgi:hypothetical protein